MRFLHLTFVLALWLEGVMGTKKHPPPRSPYEALVDVAIIGGGSAGIHAAIQLKDAGASVLVLEKKGQIGGHAETYINQETGAVNNIGVIIFENTDLVRRYFARLGVPTINANPFFNLSALPTYDFKLGIPIPSLDEAAEQQRQQAIREAAQSYRENVLSKYGWVDQGYFLPSPVPEELYLPLGALAAKHNFTALLPLMAQFGWYSGNQTTVSALYGIKDFGPGLLNSTFGDFILSGTGNTRSLYDAALADLDYRVVLNTTIISVDRHTSPTGVTVVISQPSSDMHHTIVAKKLLVAIPPLLQNVLSLDLSREEQALFAKFTSLGYFAGVARVPGWDSRTLVNYGASTPFHQRSIPGSIGFLATATPEEFGLGVGFDTDHATDADGEAVVRRELATLAAAGAVPADAADTVTFPATSFHKPFNVRVRAVDIKDGFYAKVMALQGSRNTYWTGAAWAGQNSALVWSFNEGTVIPALKRDLGLE
jgi:hypothetical protein